MLQGQKVVMALHANDACTIWSVSLSLLWFFVGTKPRLISPSFTARKVANSERILSEAARFYAPLPDGNCLTLPIDYVPSTVRQRERVREMEWVRQTDDKCTRWRIVWLHPVKAAIRRGKREERGGRCDNVQICFTASMRVPEIEKVIGRALLM